MHPLIVRCPTCDRPVEWSTASQWRPFCSERCQLIDRGAWFAEKHAIPGEEPALEANPDEEQGSG